VSYLEDFNRHVHISNDLRFLTMQNCMFVEYGVCVCVCVCVNVCVCVSTDVLHLAQVSFQKRIL